MTNELKSMNRWHDEDREEFRTLRKEYEVNRKEWKGSDDTSFREDTRLLVQVTKLERDLHDIQKGTRTIKQGSPQILLRILSTWRDCLAGNNKLPRYNCPY